jgi:hypothetical protein
LKDSQLISLLIYFTGLASTIRFLVYIFRNKYN